MKYFLDNCLPPRLAQALDALDDNADVENLLAIVESAELRRSAEAPR